MQLSIIQLQLSSFATECCYQQSISFKTSEKSNRIPVFSTSYLLPIGDKNQQIWATMLWQHVPAAQYFLDQGRVYTQ